ncbi:hypothetical protein D9613_011623 [Agrocybe pediades]|uniref:Ricin B lectin domain-containing protein n=1 Tax=Agrocybe pediades TaxID=84607 RepID=A0A8H4QX12_9AGAR|nr:hypothetical protein D9613_011623 [Agrocybe pediades]
MALDTSNIFRIRSTAQPNVYLGVTADGYIELVTGDVASAPNNQASTVVTDVWVATVANTDVSIPGAPLIMGYNLKNLGTNQYFSWTFPNSKVNQGGESLTTVPSATVVSLMTPAVPDGTNMIFFRGRNATYPSIVWTGSGIVYGWPYAFTSASQYYALSGTEVRWIFEPAGKVAPRFTLPIVKKDPLPKGLYRIRSFTGNYVLTMPEKPLEDGKVIPYVAKQVPKNEYQRWQVTPQENGLYTISNSGNNMYLAGPTNNLTTGTLLRGQSPKEDPKPFEWVIQSVNGVLFFVGVPTATLSMGFADYDANESEQVALTTSDNAPSQIWLFETMQPLASATFSQSRWLKPGSYIIELSQTNAYLVVSDTHDLTTDARQSQATRFQVTYKDENASNFTLSYTKGNPAEQFYIIGSTSNGGRVETTDEEADPTEWAVLRLEAGEDVYYIVQAGVQDSQRSVSSRRIISMGRSYFAIDPLARGEVMQMFRFRSVL